MAKVTTERGRRRGHMKADIGPAEADQRREHGEAHDQQSEIQLGTVMEKRSVAAASAIAAGKIVIMRSQ